MISAHALKATSGPAPHDHGLGLAIVTGRDASAPSDDVLVNRIARGEQAALRALMARHQVRISRFVRRFVSDRSVVEDLVCDTFFAAWQQAPHFENRSSVATWLMAIARYKALSARERQTLPTEPLDEVLATTIVETGLQPDAAVERADWARFLRQCLSSLPAEQAQLIELVYYRDKSIKEVALTDGNSGEHGQVAHVPGPKEACRDAQRGRSRRRFRLDGTGPSARPGRPEERACTTDKAHRDSRSEAPRSRVAGFHAAGTSIFLPPRSTGRPAHRTNEEDRRLRQ